MRIVYFGLYESIYPSKDASGVLVHTMGRPSRRVLSHFITVLAVTYIVLLNTISTLITINILFYQYTTTIAMTTTMTMTIVSHSHILITLAPVFILAARLAQSLTHTIYIRSQHVALFAYSQKLLMMRCLTAELY